MTDTIYRRPADYDLEHQGADEDIEGLLRIVQSHRPRRVLELGSGSGRLAIPLASLGARESFEVVGLELADEMRAAAADKRAAAPPNVRRQLTLEAGDMRSWRGEAPFDVVVCADSSITHLLTLEDQLATWRAAFANLRPGGVFVVDVVMALLPVYADSFQTPARTLVELDLDTKDQQTGERLLRYKTTHYLAHEQRARIRFLYDKFSAQDRGSSSPPAERYISDFESHVYFPHEVQLLYLCTGFTVEAVFGDYRLRALDARSRQMIVIGRRPADDTAEP